MILKCVSGFGVRDTRPRVMAEFEFYMFVWGPFFFGDTHKYLLSREGWRRGCCRCARSAMLSIDDDDDDDDGLMNI